jgi:hypothetical protein
LRPASLQILRLGQAVCFKDCNEVFPFFHSLLFRFLSR